MTQLIKPMLACEADLTKLKFPLYASPKLDGIRAMIKGGVVLSRSFKPIPNLHVQKLFGKAEYEGFDGELIVGSPWDKDVFNKTSGAVRRKEGEPDVEFYVFDKFDLPSIGCYARLAVVNGLMLHIPTHLSKVSIHKSVCLLNMEELLAYEQTCLDLGYEGLILRSPSAPYKYGRSTMKEGALLKLKRFEDSEARVLAVEELMSNQNDARLDAFGRTERSSHKENLVPAGTMGRLFVEDIHTGQRFHIGTGFTAAQRDWWWKEKSYCKPLPIIKYKFFPVGVVDLPRHPVYLGLREDFDMDSTH